MKKLDLAISWKGGIPTVFATNLIRGGDYATICFIHGSLRGELEQDGKYFLDVCSENKKYLDHVKEFLLSINDSISFANDQPNQSFLNPNEVLEKALSLRDLMPFEQRMIATDLIELHTAYVAAIKNNKQPELPSELKHREDNASLYPYRAVYNAVCKMI